jgi:ribosomal-protein-serine acetyltransferase
MSFSQRTGVCERTSSCDLDCSFLRAFLLWPQLISVDDAISLEKVRHGHATDIFRLVSHNRAHLEEWMPWVKATKSALDTEKFITDAVAGELRGSEIHYAIRYVDRIVGLIGFPKIDAAHHSAWLGFWLEAASQGKGIVTSGIRQLIVEGSSREGLVEFFGACGGGNRRSKAVFKRLGFRIVSTQKSGEWLNGAWIEHEVYKIDIDSFETKASELRPG